MAKKDRLAVLNAILAQGVIPVFFHPDTEVCAGVIEACAEGGAHCVELTNRGEFAPRLFHDLSRRFASNAEVILGAGSIVDAPTAALYIASGANFIVGPSLNSEIARLCNRRKIAYSPGCATATEIAQAEELGCEIVKMFPGGALGGPDFVRAILGPCPWTRLMPTGGVEPTEESLGAWFGAGAAAVGIGSKLITKDLLQRKDYAGIAARVAATLALARRIRGEMP